MGGMGLDVPAAPSPDASRRETLQALWTSAGLQAVDTREIVVERTFLDFNDYWTTILGSPSAGPQLHALSPGEVAQLQARLRAGIPADSTGQITYSARANAVKGTVPPAQVQRG
jgi:hypothetical protein